MERRTDFSVIYIPFLAFLFSLINQLAKLATQANKPQLLCLVVETSLLAFFQGKRLAHD